MQRLLYIFKCRKATLTQDQYSLVNSCWPKASNLQWTDKPRFLHTIANKLYQPESAKVTTDGWRKFFSRFTALTADENLSFSEQTNTETGVPPDLRVPECNTKTPPPRTRLFSTGVPSSHEKLGALPFDHHEENILKRFSLKKSRSKC